MTSSEDQTTLYTPPRSLKQLCGIFAQNVLPKCDEEVGKCELHFVLSEWIHLDSEPRNIFITNGSQSGTNKDSSTPDANNIANGIEENEQTQASVGIRGSAVYVSERVPATLHPHWPTIATGGVRGERWTDFLLLRGAATQLSHSGVSTSSTSISSSSFPSTSSSSTSTSTSDSRAPSIHFSLKRTTLKQDYNFSDAQYLHYNHAHWEHQDEEEEEEEILSVVFEVSQLICLLRSPSTEDVSSRLSAVSSSQQNCIYFQFSDGVYVMPDYIFPANWSGPPPPPDLNQPSTALEPLMIDDFEQMADTLLALVGLQSRLVDARLTHRRKVEEKIRDCLQNQEVRRRKWQALGIMRTRVESLRERRAELASSCSSCRAELAARRKASRAEEKALRSARERLEGARNRLMQAESLLDGPHGRGHLRSVQRRLTTHRWWLVGNLSRIYSIQAPHPKHPSASSVVAGGLEGAAWSICGVPLSSRAGRRAGGGGGGAVAVQSLGSGGGSQTLTGVGGSSMLLSSSSSSSLSKSEAEQTSGALGYVAHCAALMAVYLDVPLRYPLKPRGSSSSIKDSEALSKASSILQVPLSSASSENWRGGGGGGGGVDEFPLFTESSNSAEGTRFAYAVFLLNKDIEQLMNAHGLEAVGPRQLLQNLKKLMNLAYVMEHVERTF